MKIINEITFKAFPSRERQLNGIPLKGALHPVGIERQEGMQELHLDIHK